MYGEGEGILGTEVRSRILRAETKLEDSWVGAPDLVEEHLTFWIGARFGSKFDTEIHLGVSLGLEL
jgi:hypothetical protein